MSGEQLLLLVDDEPGVLAQYIVLAQLVGINFLAFANARDAIDRIKEGGVSAVVTDGLNGGFSDVILAAQEHGIPNESIVLASGTSSLKNIANELKVNFVDKGEVARGKVKMADVFSQLR